jgi:hypothetical protein
MPVIDNPGLTDAPEDFWGELDSMLVPGELYPNQQLSITIVINNIMGGTSPSITFSIDQLSGDGTKWTSIWNLGAQSAPGTIGPTTINPPGGATAFDPPEVRLSWTTTGAPTQLDFTPSLSAS